MPGCQPEVRIIPYEQAVLEELNPEGHANEIESVVYTHPDITECAAIGVPKSNVGKILRRELRQ